MAAYAIMRCKKLSGMGSVAASLKHAYRERETPNADISRTPDNEHRAAKSTNQAMGRMRELLPEKRRKDAVLAVEYVMTASPEWWAKAGADQQDAFFDQAHKWLAQKYGADRIITATVHRDESTPHLSAFVVPLTQDGRLSAKEFVGNRKQMQQDQTTFAEAVKDLGLARGIEGSRAKHQTVKAYYAALERQPSHTTITPEALEPQVLQKGFFVSHVEAPDMVAQRLTDTVQEAYAPAVKAAAGAHIERRKARETQETAQTLRDRLKPILEALEPLNRDMKAHAMEIIKAVGSKLLTEQREVEQQRRIERQRGHGHER